MAKTSTNWELGRIPSCFKTAVGSMPTLRNEDCERYKMDHPFTLAVRSAVE